MHVWTVDEPGDVELCLRLGVDTIISNYPLRVLEQLGRAPARAVAPPEPSVPGSKLPTENGN